MERALVILAGLAAPAVFLVISLLIIILLGGSPKTLYSVPAAIPATYVIIVALDRRLAKRESISRSWITPLLLIPTLVLIIAWIAGSGSPSQASSEEKKPSPEIPTRPASPAFSALDRLQVAETLRRAIHHSDWIEVPQAVTYEVTPETPEIHTEFSCLGLSDSDASFDHSTPISVLWTPQEKDTSLTQYPTGDKRKNQAGAEIKFVARDDLEKEWRSVPTLIHPTQSATYFKLRGRKVGQSGTITFWRQNRSNDPAVRLGTVLGKYEGKNFRRGTIDPGQGQEWGILPPGNYHIFVLPCHKDGSRMTPTELQEQVERAPEKGGGLLPAAEVIIGQQRYSWHDPNYVRGPSLEIPVQLTEPAQLAIVSRLKPMGVFVTIVAYP